MKQTIIHLIRIKFTTWSDRLILRIQIYNITELVPTLLIFYTDIRWVDMSTICFTWEGSINYLLFILHHGYRVHSDMCNKPGISWLHTTDLLTCNCEDFVCCLTWKQMASTNDIMSLCCSVNEHLSTDPLYRATPSMRL